jgi:hypothetical protein
MVFLVSNTWDRIGLGAGVAGVVGVVTGGAGDTTTVPVSVVA